MNAQWVNNRAKRAPVKATAASRNDKPRSQMTSKPTQEELQAATNATLRAHATSEEAKALVAKLASIVDEHAHAVGLRKNKRGKTAAKLQYATGAFLANLLRAHGPEQSSEWVYRSLYRKGFSRAAVSYLTFKELLEG